MVALAYGCNSGAQQRAASLTDSASALSSTADELFTLRMTQGEAVERVRLSVTIDVPSAGMYQMTFTLADTNENGNWDAGEDLVVREPTELLNTSHRNIPMQVTVSRRNDSGTYTTLASPTWTPDAAP